MTGSPPEDHSGSEGDIEISVVIPALNAESTLGLQLRALAEQTFRGRWEVIVADNGSEDGTRQVVLDHQGLLPDLRLIDASAERGQAYARTAALHLARGDLIACCDADDRVSPGWLQALYDQASRYPIVAGPCLAGIGPDLDPGPETVPDNLPRALRFLPIASGGCMAVKRDVALAAGGWDNERFSMSGSEDIDFSWRVQLAGNELGYAPEAILYVRQRGTPGGLFRQRYNWGRSDVVLFARYRSHGLRRRTLRSMIGAWRAALRRLVASPGDHTARAEAVAVLARDLGRWYQSVRSLTWFW